MTDILPVATLDGPAGVGKTTLARRVAQACNVPYLDTGAMFRCLALKLGPGADALPPETLRERCLAWTFRLTGRGAESVLLCNDIPVRGEVRTEEVGMLAARLGCVPAVRDILKDAQRALGVRPLVVEGRDMGTVVFPTARCKFFLDATPEVRAVRRLNDLAGRGLNPPPLDVLTDQIRQRDALDRNRAVAPMRPAADALCIDTSDLDIQGVLGVILHRIDVQGGLRG